MSGSGGKNRLIRGHEVYTLCSKSKVMEPGFWNVIVYVVPALVLVFFLFKREGHEDRVVGHKMYKNYRKSRISRDLYI